MPIPKTRYEININTFVLLAGFAATAIGWGVVWGRATSEIDAATEFRLQTEQRLIAVETAVRKVDNLEYRITVNEQSTQAVTRTLDDLRTAVNTQSGDIRVVREILQRLENKSQTGQVRFGPSVAAVP